jgi:hypothetical protein
MSDELVKALLNTMTAEQKSELLNKLMDSLTPPSQDQQAEPIQQTEPKQEETVSSQLRSNVTEDFRVVQNSDLDKRKTPVRAKKNQWVDNGEDRDPEFNPEKFERMGKAARNRDKIKKRTIECHVCGRSFQVNPSLVHGEYVRCNRCTGR